MSDGKNYEIFVQNLQQALINSEEFMSQNNIEIERNKKITDNCGIDREFDLYWEYEVAGLTYKTVIECKDYASTISVEKIDALIGKTKDIPDLIPVFATKTGYQSGAKTKAKHNKIELLIVREQKDEDWEDKEGNPLIKQININIQISQPNRINSIKVEVDKDWVEKNPHINLEKYIVTPEMQDKVFVEDIDKQMTYSFLELSDKLKLDSSNSGEHLHEEVFLDAYLLIDEIKVKLKNFKIGYTSFEPTLLPIRIDDSKELLGVIEYLSKSSSTAIFKDKIIKNWR
ncbi:restriction endonuclease [Psychrobacter sp. W2-37-MNA-CIBAN-0211]|uniref:restriction endonuclease n=1 Tax=Psychrobacter sp. W2-37-MNA-CIBAN-0211 TaxID=3140443 RepID=UPI0033267626